MQRSLGTFYACIIFDIHFASRPKSLNNLTDLDRQSRYIKDGMYDREPHH